jgi:hypothetical protein
MSTRIIAFLAAASLLLGSIAIAAPSNVRQPVTISTIDDQQSVSLTIYNVNLGLVRDLRALKLPRGVGELRFMDVASQIVPASVHIKSMVHPSSLSVLEQNYEYDLLNPQKLLEKYVGKEVKLHTKNAYTEREEVVTATLLSNNGGPVFRIGDEITYGHPGRIIFPGVPESLMAKPTLVWLAENNLLNGQKVEASYLTSGINWRSDYVITLNERDDKADLFGWVTIDNKSGTTYRNAKLKLVAGDVNRLRDEADYRDKMGRVAEMAAKPAAPGFREESFFEYHLYTLKRVATVKDNQTKQISLIQANTLPVMKELLYYGASQYYRSKYGDVGSNQKVAVFVEIGNHSENGLGIPLPKGIVRVYKHDSEGSLQFIGEDSIDHTATNEKIRIKLGDAFDVVGSRKQSDWKKIAYDTYEAAFEVTLRNRKKENVVVKVVEPIPGDWKMLSSSHEHTKSEAFTAEFRVPVRKDEEAKLTYRVRMRF